MKTGLAENLQGRRFSRLTAVQRVGTSRNGSAKWECQCECGGTKNVLAGNLKSGQVRSCGCLLVESRKVRTLTHGESIGGPSLEYVAWNGMMHRCYDKNRTDFKDYGGRGITVCERWKGHDGVSNFVTDMGRKPSSKHSLDRFPDNNGPYSPQNCRWATPAQQSRNTRRNRHVTFNGQTKVLADWAIEYGVDYFSLHSRIFQRGWTMERALNTPVRKHSKGQKTC